MLSLTVATAEFRLPASAERLKDRSPAGDHPLTLPQQIIDRLATVAALPRGPATLEQTLVNRKSYLNKTGWFESIALRKPTFEGESVPWFNYGFVRFLKSRVNKSLKVFEWGSGYSTLWWESHCLSVKSIEHDERWARTVQNLIGPDTEVQFVALDYDGDYCRALKAHHSSFDIVVIDGRDRVNCLKNCIDHLSATAIIVFDNSQRAHYRDGIESFKTQYGFKEIQFSGMAPMTYVESFTSVFYRNENCFGI